MHGPRGGLSRDKPGTGRQFHSVSSAGVMQQSDMMCASMRRDSCRQGDRAEARLFVHAQRCSCSAKGIANNDMAVS
jgi:hypothetical protein